MKFSNNEETNFFAIVAYLEAKLIYNTYRIMICNDDFEYSFLLYNIDRTKEKLFNMTGKVYI